MNTSDSSHVIFLEDDQENTEVTSWKMFEDGHENHTIEEEKITITKEIEVIIPKWKWHEESQIFVYGFQKENFVYEGKVSSQNGNSTSKEE